MKVRFSTWIRIATIVCCLGISLSVVDFISPSWWSEKNSIVGFGVLTIAIVIPNVLFWTGIGKIELVFSEADKQKTTYKLWKYYCEMFGRSMIDGSRQQKLNQ